MAKNRAGMTIKECDRQLDGLYIHFGKFLYDNIEKENLYYYFESPDKQLDEQAAELLKKCEE